MKSSVYGAGAAACGLAAVLSMSVAGVHRAYAAPTSYAIAQTGDISVSLLSPAPHTNFSGAKPVEIDAFYQSSDSNQITEVDLYIDGVKAAAKALATPESRGVISFLIDASALSAGGHSIVVRATAADAEVVSVKGSFVYVEGANSTDNAGLPVTGGNSTGAPDLSITSPATDSRVEGTVKISVSAHDASGSNPYVSYFVDRQFKTLRNYPPYDYIWDTTSLPNGLHTVEIYAYNDAQNVGPAKVLRLYVNNPGGFTGIRTHRTAKVALVAPIKKARTVVPILPVLAAKHIKPVVGAPVLATTHPALKSVQTLPAVNQSETVGASTQIGAVAQPKVSAAKSILAPARMSRINVTLDATEAISQIVQTNGTIGESFEPALTSPFKSLKPISAQPAAVKHKLAAPVLAQSAPAHAVKQSAAKAPMQIATIRLPQSELSSPFLAAPHVIPAVIKPVSVKPMIVHRLIAPVSVKPVMTHVTTMPAELRPLLMAPAQHQTAIKVAVPVVHTSKVIKSSAPIQVKTTEIRRISVHIAATPALMSMLRCKGEMAVMIGDRTIHLDRPLAAHGSILFGPLRQIFEFEGGELTWTQSNQTVTGHSPTRNLSLQIGSRNAQVNDKHVTLPGTPYLQRGRTMVPMDILPEVLNANMKYDSSNGHLLITSKN